MPRGNWSRGELDNLTKLQLRDILRDEFNKDVSGEFNSKATAELKDMILAEQEKKKAATVASGGGSGRSSKGAGSAPRPSGKISVTVVCGGSNPEQYDIDSGTTVDTVRQQLADALNIGSGFEARVNGSTVPGTAKLLQGGVYLEFVKPAGSKAHKAQ